MGPDVGAAHNFGTLGGPDTYGPCCVRLTREEKNRLKRFDEVRGLRSFAQTDMVYKWQGPRNARSVLGFGKLLKMPAFEVVYYVRLMHVGSSDCKLDDRFSGREQLE